MRAAVHSVLQGLQLQQPVSSDMAMGLLSDIHHGALLQRDAVQVTCQAPVSLWICLYEHCS